MTPITQSDKQNERGETKKTQAVTDVTEMTRSGLQIAFGAATIRKNGQIDELWAVSDSPPSAEEKRAQAATLGYLLILLVGIVWGLALPYGQQSAWVLGLYGFIAIALLVYVDTVYVSKFRPEAQTHELPVQPGPPGHRHPQGSGSGQAQAHEMPVRPLIEREAMTASIKVWYYLSYVTNALCIGTCCFGGWRLRRIENDCHD